MAICWAQPPWLVNFIAKKVIHFVEGEAYQFQGGQVVAKENKQRVSGQATAKKVKNGTYFCKDQVPDQMPCNPFSMPYKVLCGDSFK